MTESTQLELSWQLLKSTRPLSWLFAASWCIAGFVYLDLHEREGSAFVMTVSTVFWVLVTAGIMVVNDYIDVHVDVRKGKTFARDHAELVRQFWIALIVGAAVCIVLLSSGNPYSAHVLIMTMIIGCTYCWTYSRHPVVKNGVVALCATSPVMYGALHFGHDANALAGPFAFVFLCVFASEMLKDIEDVEYDRGHKRTFATEYGTWFAQQAVRVVVIAAVLVMVFCMQFGFLFLLLPALMYSSVAMPGARWLAERGLDVAVCMLCLFMLT